MRGVVASTAAAVALVLAGAAAAEEAGDGTVLTLARAVELAVSGNAELEAAHARADAATADVAAARVEGRPRLDAMASFQRTDEPVLVFGHKLSQGRFQAEDFALGSLNDPAAVSDWTTRVEATVPIWTGGRVAAAVAAATGQRDAVAAGAEATRQRVVHDAIVGYVTAVLARSERDAAKEARETAEAHVALIRDLFASGLVVESDLRQAEVRASELRERGILAEAGIEIADAALAATLGLPTATFTLPADLAEDPAGAEPQPAADLVAAALEKRPDLAALRAQAAAAEASARLARAGRRPSLGVSAAWSAHDADFFGRDGSGWAAGAALRVPLFDGGRTAPATTAAEARLREVEAHRAAVEAAVAVEVRTARARLLAAGERRVQADLAGDLARRALEIVTDRYKEGLATFPELLEAETARTDARRRAVAARSDLLAARAALDLATGTL